MSDYTPRLYSSDELALEREMAELGEQRHKTRVNNCRELNRMSMTTGGRALLRKYVTPIAKHLEKWVEECMERPGSMHTAAPTIVRVGYDVAALLTVQAVIDGIHRPRMSVVLAGAIGKSLETEWRMREVERNNPNIYREALDRAKGGKAKSKANRAFGLARYHGILPEKWPRMEKTYAGLICLDAVFACTDLICTRTIRDRHKTKTMVLPTDAVLEWMESAEESAAALSPIYMPMVDRPQPWEGTEGGGYLTDLVLNRSIARFRGRAQKSLVDNHEADIGMVCTALNKLQDTPWVVNRDVLMTLDDVMETGAGAGFVPSDADLPLPDVPDDIATDENVKRRWCAEASDVYRINTARQSQRALIAMTRIVAKRMVDHEKIFFPHRMDFRSRAYPTPYFLSIQGPDVSRAAVSFAEPEKRTKEGDEWELIHAANTWGAKGTLQARKDFARKNLEQIAQRVFQDPIDNRDWTEADEPWRFLAWCLSHGEGGESTSLPVSVDASNNGHQLFALMTGDRDLAAWTNAIATSEPRDIYLECAGRATEKLKELSEGGRLPEALSSWENKDEVDPEAIASTWLEVLPDGIPRKCAKRPIMTMPYGVTNWSAQAYVRDWYKSEWGGDGPFGRRPHRSCMLLSTLLMEEVKSVCKSSVAVMDWLRNVSAEVCSKHNTAVQWITPSGWPVYQHYRTTGAKRVKVDLAGSIRSLSIRQVTGNLSKREQRAGISPNFVHSVDGSVLAHALSRFDGPVGAVHDAFITTSPRIPALLHTLKEAVAHCAITADPLGSFHKYISTYCPQAEIPPPPRFGEIDPSEVLESNYIFS